MQRSLPFDYQVMSKVVQLDKNVLKELTNGTRQGAKMIIFTEKYVNSDDSSLINNLQKTGDIGTY